MYRVFDAFSLIGRRGDSAEIIDEIIEIDL